MSSPSDDAPERGDKLWTPRYGRCPSRRKRAKHRSRRPRRAALGELVQWDSSIHPWLEARGPADLVLVSMHDDATSRMQFGRFVKRDTGAENRRAIIACLKRHGRPLAVYADHAGHFGQRRKDGKRTKSVIARGLEALGVELILAGSPQAKGRIERTYGTAQDRLVKEMRVAGVATIEEANRFLEEHWIPFWNEHFAVAPADLLDAHRPLPPDADLEALFADTAARVVGRDFTVRWKNAFWQIPQEEAVAAGVRPGSRIVVERRLSGELRLRHGGRYLAARALGAARPAPPAPAPAPPRPRPKPSSRDRTIRGAGISAKRSRAPSPGGSAASPPRARRPERRGDPACPRPPGLGVQAPRLHPAPGPPRRPRSNPPPHQGGGHFYFGLTLHEPRPLTPPPKRRP